MIFTDWVGRAIARLRRPTAEFPIAPNQLLSGLDVVAETLGMEWVESLFRLRSTGVPVDRLQRFLGDPEAELALKKSIHLLFEERLRHRALLIDPPPGYGLPPIDLSTVPGPLDFEAEQWLAAKTGCAVHLAAPARWARVRLWGSALFWGLSLIGMALLTGLRRCAVSVQPIESRVIAPNFAPADRLTPLAGALRDIGGRDERSPILIFMESAVPVFHPDSPFPVLNPADFRVPGRFWWGTLIPSTFGLVGSIWFWLSCHGRDPRLALIAMETLHLAVLAVKLWPIALNLRFQACLDNAEYSVRHNLKAILFRRHGAGPLVRWPITQLDSSGALLSYLGYDIALWAGPYQQDNYGFSWSPRMRNESVGHLQLDDRMQQPDRLDPAIVAAIDAERGKGSKIIAFFGPSSVFGADSVAIEVLSVILSLLDQRPDWFLVVKPKGNNDLLQKIADEPGCSGWLERSNVLWINYPEPGREVCPVGYMIDAMEIGVGGLGSTQIESLARGRPYISYFPVQPDTPFRRHLFEDRLGTRHLDEIADMIRRRMDGDTQNDDLLWYKNAFDPFNDAQALSRAVHLLMKIPGCRSDRVRAQGNEEKV